MAADIVVEVVFALADKQRLVSVSLPPNATVADAIAASHLAGHFLGQDFDTLEVGVWGRVVEKGHILSAGDRVEIYRPLRLDPREARRQLALVGETMRASEDD